VEGPYEGMEHQTAIAYGSGYSNLSRLGGDYIIVHETAHEWWGNAVSVAILAISGCRKVSLHIPK